MAVHHSALLFIQSRSGRKSDSLVSPPIQEGISRPQWMDRAKMHSQPSSRSQQASKRQENQKRSDEPVPRWGTISGSTSPQHAIIRIIVILVTIVIAGKSILEMSWGIQSFSKGPQWSLIWTKNTAAFLLFQDLVQNNTVTKSIFFRNKPTQTLNWLPIITIITIMRIIWIIK